MELKTNSKKSVKLADQVYGADYNEALVHQVVTAVLAGARAGTAQQKSRSDVRGGGAKPWRQKGTGRARAGTIRSPLWRSGGVTFAARPRDYSQKVNRKMYKGAMRAILSELARQDRLVVVDELAVEAPKTKLLVQALKAIDVNNAVLVTEDVTENLYLAARNIPNISLVDVSGCTPVTLLSQEKVVATVGALKKFEVALA